MIGGIADKIVGEELLADYLLFLLNQTENKEYLTVYGLTEPVDDIQVFLPNAAHRMGLLMKGGHPNVTQAAQRFVRLFRMGRFGRFTLDKLT